MEQIKKILKWFTFKRVVIIITTIYVLCFFSLLFPTSTGLFRKNTKINIKRINQVATYYDNHHKTEFQVYNIYELNEKEHDNLIRQLNKVGENRELVDEAIKQFFELLNEEEQKYLGLIFLF